MRAVLALSLASLILALAGCGGTKVGSGTASSAGLLKPGALVYWQTVSDPDSDSEQWQQAEDLLKKFPDGEHWLAQLKLALENEDVTWAGDVRPALGTVVDVAVYAKTGTSQPGVVALTNPTDKGKFTALVDKLNTQGGDRAVTREVGDEWVAISDNEAALDAALKQEGEESLADDQSFKSAMADLPDDALSFGYVDPAKAMPLLAGRPGTDVKTFSMLGLDRLDFAGAWVKAADNGAELAFALRGDGADRLLGTGDPYASKLLDKVPADAFAFISFQGAGLRQQFEKLRSNPLFALGLRRVEAETGADFDGIASLLDGEVALFARPGVPIAELTLLLDSNDPSRAKAAVEQLLQRAPGELKLTVATLDGVVVISTARNPVDDLQASGDKLADSDGYSKALKSAAAPDDYTGLAYVDLTKATDLIAGYAGSQVGRNLEPLRTLVAYGTKDGTLTSALVFVEID